MSVDSTLLHSYVYCNYIPVSSSVGCWSLGDSVDVFNSANNVIYSVIRCKAGNINKIALNHLAP